MTKTTYLLSLAAASLLSVSASAAEPCKFYIGANAGYALASNTSEENTLVGIDTVTKTRLEKESRGMISSFGAGYAFNDALRSEVVLDFKPKLKGQADGFDFETREIGGALKIAYDFNSNAPVTPFVYASVGAVSVRPTIKATSIEGATFGKHLAALDADGKIVKQDDSVALLESSKQKSKTALTVGAGLGLTYNVGAFNVDLTYGVSGKGKQRILENLALVSLTEAVGSGSASTTLENIDQAKSVLAKEVNFKEQMEQSLSLGVRFTL